MAARLRAKSAIYDCLVSWLRQTRKATFYWKTDGTWLYIQCNVVSGFLRQSHREWPSVNELLTSSPSEKFRHVSRICFTSVGNEWRRRCPGPPPTQLNSPHPPPLTPPPLTSPVHDDVQSCNNRKGAITSKIEHAIKLKTSPARLAQLQQPSLAFCFSLQPMTAYRPELDGTPSLAAS